MTATGVEPRFRFLGAREHRHPFSLELVDQLVGSRQLSADDAVALAAIRTELGRSGDLPFSWTPQEANYCLSNGQESWLDYIFYRYKFKVFPELQRVTEFPIYLLIEPTSVCNLRCVMCFQVDKSFTRKPNMGFLDFDLYRRIIDEAEAGGTRAITMASRGEPTLHKKMPELLSYASGKFIDLKLNTNATRLDDEMCHGILSSSVNELVFSVDAIDAEVYEKIRVKGHFDEVLANIVRFHEIRAKHYPSSKLNTRVSGVIFRPDQDAAALAQFWSGIVDEVVSVDASARWDTYNNDPSEFSSDHACSFLWERMYVWYDGTCNPCDVDYKSYLSPGNLREASIESVWHGESYTRLRKAHVGGRRNSYVPCDRCGL